ncbi:short chain dehydrogenase [Phytophthora infestans]|uniref:Short chain dehydrogenase n=1 Tax=Phytophthora infestans TaxID=4787 RepID=A0A833T283_PHYIN|nr:short chain dehydrogenase [Phytophthora infestans]
MKAKSSPLCTSLRTTDSPLHHKMESGWIALIVLVGACIFSWLWSLLTAPRFSVHGKHVLFTGTETPLGLAVAKKYVKKGANVTLIGPAMEILEATQSELQLPERMPQCSCSSVSSWTWSEWNRQSKRLTPRATDHVVYAASRRIKPGYFWEQDVASMKEAMDVNYLGAVAALPAMIKAKTRGRIVFVSSVDSLEFPVGCGACSGSKSAIRGLADSSRNELLQYNMSVAVFYPGTSSYNLLDTSKGFETPIICNDATDERLFHIHRSKSGSNEIYSITTTWNGFLLRMLSNGVEPRNNTFLEWIFVFFAGCYHFLRQKVKERSLKAPPRAGGTAAHV